MLAISVELLHGTLRAGSADDLASTGEFDPGEWPPSPARLFAALVAADGTGARCRVTSGRELQWLEQAPPPLILADDAARVCRNELNRRFVVVDVRAPRSVQEYPGRDAAEVRPGTRLSPATPMVSYLWPDVELAAEHRQALAARAARVPYLGCADSPVRVRVSDEPPAAAPTTKWRPMTEPGPGAVALPVTFPGLLDVLDEAYERFTSGEAVRRSWFASMREWYSTRTDGPDAEQPSVVWLRFDAPVPGRFIRSVTETLRRATLELYDRWAASAPGDVPAVLHGHGFAGSGYQHVHWLALPDVGHRYATGRLFGAAVWLPPGTDPSVGAGLQAALVHLHELVLPGGRRIAVHLFDGAARPLAATPARWTGPARHWVSALPVVHERWGPVTAEEVSRWCGHAGLPEPVAFRTAAVPLIEGALSLLTIEVHRAGGERRPYSHLEVWFAEPITGPLMIGRARQFGLGLMCPADRGQRRRDRGGDA